MALHLRDFPHYFGETPVRDIGLLATEGRASLCLEDGTPVGVLDVMGSFFEFVEVGGNGDPLPASVCRCHEVVPGREYRLIMTTSAGFYRYDIGDHVRVHGFLGEAPLIEFLHRGTHTSSITGEKLTEWQVTTAFERARRHLGFGGDAFVLAPQWGDPPRYVLHVERDVQRIERLARAMDEELAKINPEYASKRGSRRLGLIVAEQLPDGALAAWNAARARRRGPVNEQFKPRYLLNDPEEEKKLAAFAVPPDQTESDSRADAEVSLGSTEHRTSSG